MTIFNSGEAEGDERASRTFGATDAAWLCSDRPEATRNSEEALEYLVSRARPGSFISIISDAITDAVNRVQKLHDVAVK